MTDLRARVRAGERLTGCFVKTPSPQVVELLGMAGMDFVVADREHAPIGTGALDLMALAGRAVGLPLLIRSRTAEAAEIWPALDMGCSGVMVPHVRTAAEARAVAGAMKYAHGRGFSPSGRAGGYGSLPAVDYRRAQDETTVFLAQIEDAAALEHLDEIAAVPEVDALFVGPADLSLSLGCAADAPELAAAIGRVTQAAHRVRKAAGLFVTDPASIAAHAARGVTVFVCGSDQGLILGGARRLMAAARA
ncbi:HpcH/HpaI aldolase family protein [Frigidibacter mobilis]|uniref:HpcH/HpaI aldolase n=1 Tax=Frigidibacter mobilis TaxID=1335048 RepID=A0A159Z1K4_9RHOB|nr:aldolase/citrate lyase family protein [Frigidibacter mobilis]AMY67918.1 HpcH/HpaI aldolase [Frigidibacter mobilis]